MSIEEERVANVKAVTAYAVLVRDVCEFLDYYLDMKDDARRLLYKMLKENQATKSEENRKLDEFGLQLLRRRDGAAENNPYET